MALEVRTRELDALGVHLLRAAVNAAFGSLNFLNRDQQQVIHEIVGEAVTNAFKHAIGNKETSLKVAEFDGGIYFEISNSSGGFPNIVPQPSNNSLSEGGYGCHLIESGAESLRQSGVEINCHYRFEPDEGLNKGQTVFCLSICK